MENTPILYSFRRCPYAMRARFALKYASISCILREVDLKNKPSELIEASSKGTVPVLLLDEKKVIDESMQIIEWALRRCDPENIGLVSALQIELATSLVDCNDNIFVKTLHRYKYKDRYPHIDFNETKKNLNEHLSALEHLLEKNKFLVNNKMSKADMAIFPFIRQAALADEEYFAHLNFPKLKNWLDFFLTHALFEKIMKKHSIWSKDQTPIFL